MKSTKGKLNCLKLLQLRAASLNMCNVKMEVSAQGNIEVLELEEEFVMTWCYSR